MKYINVSDFYQTEEDSSTYILEIILHKQKYLGEISSETFNSSHWKLDQLQEILENKKPIKQLYDRNFHYLLNGNFLKLTVNLQYKKNPNSNVTYETFELNLLKKSNGTSVSNKRSRNSESEESSERSQDSKRFRETDQDSETLTVFQKVDILFDKYQKLSDESNRNFESNQKEIEALRTENEHLRESFHVLSDKLQVHIGKTKDSLHHHWNKILQSEDDSTYEIKKFVKSELDRFDSLLHNVESDIRNINSELDCVKYSLPLEIFFFYNNKEKSNLDEIVFNLSIKRTRDFYDFLTRHPRSHKFMKDFQKINNFMVLRLEEIHNRFGFMLRPVEIFRFKKMDDILEIVETKFHTLSGLEKFEFNICLTLYELNLEYELQDFILVGNVKMVQSKSKVTNEFNLLQDYQSKSLRYNPKIGFFQSQ
jgi:FtsZ-binding cell division protein ZapB